MNCVEFGFDRSKGFGSVRRQFWPIAIDRPTRPYNIASTTAQQVIEKRRQHCQATSFMSHFHDVNFPVTVANCVSPFGSYLNSIEAI
jgi:hypothetical protein